MKRLLIAGLGGMGRELYGYLLDDLAQGRLPAGLEIGGLDDAPADRLHPEIRAIYRGRVSDYRFGEGEQVLLAVGEPQLRRQLTAVLRANGARFYTYVHASCFLSRTARLGEGVVVCPQSVVNADAWLGDHSLVNVCSSVGHDSRIGAYSVLSPFSAVSGAVVAGEALFMGTHSTLFPGVRVGDDCKLSAHSYIKTDVGDGYIVYNDSRNLEIENRMLKRKGHHE